jgi:bifunctional non-homologous end joining protein LigD
MSDQLSLRLEPERPGLPRLPDLRPMLPRSMAEPFDSADHLFEPWWGGQRALVSIGPADVAGTGDVTVIGEDGVDLTPALQELSGLAVRVDARSAVLDGEIVVVDVSGRADPAALGERLAGRSGRPVAFLAFDILHLDGRSLLSIPLSRRREMLRRVLRPGDEVVAVPAIAGEGRALWEAAVNQGIAGVLARQRSSPYLPGVRSRLWRYIPAEPTVPLPPGAADVPPPVTTAPVLALIERLPLDDEG